MLLWEMAEGRGQVLGFRKLGGNVREMDDELRATRQARRRRREREREK